MTQNERTTTSYPPAIRDESILNKISFVVTGKAIDDANLPKLLNDYLKFRADKIITRQAINGWLNNGAVPRKRNGTQFLNDFLKQSVTISELSQPQKKVYKQLQAYFRRKLLPKLDEPPVFQPNSRSTYNLSQQGLMINNLTDLALQQESHLAWEGWYVTYRNRLLATDKTRNPIACEVIHVRALKKALHFSHWHRKDGGNNITKFDGGVLVNPDSTWMVGLEEPYSRLRICHFKNVRSTNKDSMKLRWGLMHSDMPATASKEPASTRILLVRKDQKINNEEDFIKNNVQYRSIDELPHRLRPLIKRMIPNDICASSIDGGIEPSSSHDMVLRVDERTLQSANTIIADDVV